MAAIKLVIQGWEPHIWPLRHGILLSNIPLQPSTGISQIGGHKDVSKGIEKNLYSDRTVACFGKCLGVGEDKCLSAKQLESEFFFYKVANSSRAFCRKSLSIIQTQSATGNRSIA